MTIQLSSQWLITAEKQSALEKLRTAQREAAMFAVHVRDLRKQLQDLRGRIDYLEDGLKTLNECDTLISGIFGCSNSVLATSSLLGMDISDCGTSEFRNRLVAYVLKMRGKTARVLPNNTETEVIRKAVTLMVSDATFKANPSTITREIANCRNRLDATNAELAAAEHNRVAKTVKRVANVDRRKDATTHYRDTQFQAIRDQKDLEKLTKLAEEFTDRIGSATMRKELQARGVELRQIQPAFDAIVTELNSVERQLNESKLLDQKVSKVSKSMRDKLEAKRKELLEICEIEHGEDEDYQARVQKINTGIDAVIDKKIAAARSSAEAESAKQNAGLQQTATNLRARMTTLLRQIEALKLDIGNKTCEDYIRELGGQLQQTRQEIAVRRESIAPQIQKLGELNNTDAWLAYVRTALSNRTGAAAFPSIARQLEAAVSKKGSGLLPGDFPELDKVARVFLSDLFSRVEKSIQADAETTEKRVLLAATELLAANNVAAAPGTGLTAQDAVDEFISECMQAFQNREAVVIRVTHLLSLTKLKEKSVNRSGVSIGLGPNELKSRQAQLLAVRMCEPGGKFQKGLRALGNVAALHYRELLSLWVHRFVRID